VYTGAKVAVAVVAEPSIPLVAVAEGLSNVSSPAFNTGPKTKQKFPQEFLANRIGNDVAPSIRKLDWEERILNVPLLEAVVLELEEVVPEPEDVVLELEAVVLGVEGAATEIALRRAEKELLIPKCVLDVSTSGENDRPRSRYSAPLEDALPLFEAF
jgi:hypothetical protein